MAKRKITGREVLKDIKAGMDDPELMDKYKLSAQGLQSVFNKLVNAGVLTQAELDARVPVSETNRGTWSLYLPRVRQYPGEGVYRVPPMWVRCTHLSQTTKGAGRARESALQGSRKEIPFGRPKWRFGEQVRI